MTGRRKKVSGSQFFINKKILKKEKMESRRFILKKGERLWHYKKRWREQLRSKDTFGIGGMDHVVSERSSEGEFQKIKRFCSKELLQNADYKKVCWTVMMVNFT